MIVKYAIDFYFWSYQKIRTLQWNLLNYSIIWEICTVVELLESLQFFLKQKNLLGCISNVQWWHFNQLLSQTSYWNDWWGHFVDDNLHMNNSTLYKQSNS